MTVLVGSLKDIKQHKRHVLTLRSTIDTADYLCLILFHFPGAPDEQERDEFHCIVNECPHLAAPLQDAPIEDLEDGDRMVVCPLHSYDFSLSTGEGSSGLHLCTYPVIISNDDIYIKLEDYALLSTRPVSQTFPPVASTSTLSIEELSLQEEPKTITGWARQILLTANPILKVQYTRKAASLFRAGKLKTVGSALPPDEPPREALKLVEAGKAGKRGKGNSEKSRIALLHSLANIEQWAIDLAWDIIARFPTYNNKRVPLSFFSDFIQVAEDEAKHFSLLVNRLEALGSFYGALPVHGGLWNSARDTFHSLPARLCIIHLVHESRGLDVNPTQIARMKAAGDLESEAALTTIHNDEITHVMAGHKWLTYLCGQEDPPLDPIQVFRKAVTEHFHGGLKPPFNAADRLKAGLTPEFYEDLRGAPKRQEDNSSTLLSRATAGG